MGQIAPGEVEFLRVQIAAAAEPTEWHTMMNRLVELERVERLYTMNMDALEKASKWSFTSSAMIS